MLRNSKPSGIEGRPERLLSAGEQSDGLGSLLESSASSVVSGVGGLMNKRQAQREAKGAITNNNKQNDPKMR